MKSRLTPLALMAIAAGSSQTAIASDVGEAIAASDVSGNFRSYYNTRDYDIKTDEAALAVGGALRVKTGDLGGFKLGLGYYTAQDFGTNDSDPAKVNKRLGSELEVLAEGFITYSANDTTVTLGRQKINTPFANAGDAFIVPFTYEGTSIVYKGISNLTLEADYINAIKNRNSDEFTEVGAWSANRYGVDTSASESTVILGATYAKDSLKVQAWYYDFEDMFTTSYLQANYGFAANGSVKPFVAFQYGSQAGSGDELLGEVDSSLVGVQFGAGFGKSKVTFAYNTVSEKDAYKNGAFLAPYNFSTSPLFTNSMLQNMENGDSGEAMKMTFNHSFPKVKLKVSYAELEFDSSTDREAFDFDATYDMSEFSPGLSLRYRLEVVMSTVTSVEQTNQRFQLQYKF